MCKLRSKPGVLTLFRRDARVVSLAALCRPLENFAIKLYIVKFPTPGSSVLTLRVLDLQTYPFELVLGVISV